MNPYYLYSDMPKLSQHKVWAEIDTRALADNYRTLCNHTALCKHICVVKSEAYGHVSEICVRTLMDAGCSFFAVSCVEEAIKVRRVSGNGVDIIILGYTDPTQADILEKNDLIQAIIGEKYAEELSASAKEKKCRVRVHVAIDTGMGRIGLCAKNDGQCDAAADYIRRLSYDPHIQLEGVFTHFAEADGEYHSTVARDSKTRIQYERFDRIRKNLLPDLPQLFFHASNSAAALRFPEYSLDGVRFGISLYGVPPSRHFERITRPVMSLCTMISHIHVLSPGDKVGYGGQYAPDSERTIATLPIGYADGFLRAYKGFFVTVRTENGDFKAPVVGNVCMDQCMIDVTDIPAMIGDRVIIFGEDPEDLSTLATLAGTIEYEVLCLITARVPRILKNDEKNLLCQSIDFEESV